MKPGALVLGGLAVLPVCWAAVTAGPGRLTPAEAVAYVLIVAATVAGAGRWPAPSLGLAVVAWIVAFVSRAEVDKTIGAAVLGIGLVAGASLAGRSPRSGQRDVAVLVLGPGAAAAASLWVTGGVDTAIAAAIGAGVLSVVPWTVGRYRRRSGELVRAGWERAQLWEREAERAVEVAQLRERTRLAGEMHDLIGHELARVALGVGALEVDPGLDAARRAAAGRAREGVTAAAERLADVVRMLRTDGAVADDASVVEVLDRARQAGLDVAVGVALDEPADPLIAATVRRVVAEALTNAMKHAPGAPVHVDVQVDTEIDGGDGGGRDGGGRDSGGRDGGGRDGGGGVRVRVENARPASPPPIAPPGGGSGLAGLAERVRLIGGQLVAGASPDGGWILAAELPLAPGAPARMSDTERHRKLAEDQVQRSAWRAALVSAAVGGTATALVGGYMVFDAATSALDPADFARFQLGIPRAEMAAFLPTRTRTDDPETGVPAPARSVCEYYSTHPNPFDAHRADLFRLCFVDGVLVDKDVLVRSGDDLTTFGR